jgi:hypothetical protein
MDRLSLLLLRVVLLEQLLMLLVVKLTNALVRIKVLIAYHDLILLILAL